MNRFLTLLSVTSIAVLTSCGGGGGDNGGGGDGGDPAPPLPLVSQFGLGQTGSQSLAFTVVQGGSAPVITVSQMNNLRGSFNKQTHERQLYDGGSVRVDSGGVGLGVLTVSLNQALQWTGSQTPSGGAVRVDIGAVQTVMTILNNGATVRITTNGVSQNLTWAQFEDINIFDTTGNANTRGAALGYQILNLVQDRVVDVAHHLTEIANHELDLQKVGSGKTYTQQGDYLAPISKKGHEGITWTDVSDPVAQVGPGDSFTCVHDNMWTNDSATTEEPLYTRGSIKFTNYMENATPVFLGFETVEYQELGIQTVEEYPAGTFKLLGGTIFITGQFSISFGT